MCMCKEVREPQRGGGKGLRKCFMLRNNANYTNETFGI